MGNCSRKLRREFNAWHFRKANGSTHIGHDMFCPNCNQYFGPNTTYTTVNYHLDTCLAAQETLAGDTQVNSMTDVGQQFGFIVNGKTTSGPNERFIWLKKTGPDNVVIWEKVASEMNFEGNMTRMNADAVKKLSFEDKNKWWKVQTEKFRIPWNFGADHLNINRHKLLETTLKGLQKVNLRKEVKIEFDEEKKVNDAGGLLREFVHLICLECFSVDKDLFVKTESQEMIYKINPQAQDTKQNLDLYQLVGKVFGKALFEQITVPVQLDRFLIKQIIQDEFTLEDLASVDKALYNSLKYISENPINNSDVFEEYFVTPSPLDGSHVDLVTNGAQTQITDENKQEFIKLQLEWIGKKFVEKKVEAFLKGLYQVIPSEIFQVYLPEEFEMKLNGLPFIDVGDWEAHTQYKGTYDKNSKEVKWFWEVMKGLSQEQLSTLFHFCTGSKRTPVEGFRVLQSNRGEFKKFTIESVKYNKEDPGLKAHTCFNRLELPQYPKKELLKENLLNTLKVDFTGVFGIE